MLRKLFYVKTYRRNDLYFCLLPLYQRRHCQICLESTRQFDGVRRTFLGFNQLITVDFPLLSNPTHSTLAFFFDAPLPMSLDKNSVPAFGTPDKETTTPPSKFARHLWCMGQSQSSGKRKKSLDPNSAEFFAYAQRYANHLDERILNLRHVNTLMAQRVVKSYISPKGTNSAQF